MVGQWAPFYNCIPDECNGENEIFLFTQDRVLNLYVKLTPKHLIERTVLQCFVDSLHKDSKPGLA